jgi:hypothetical protein
MTSPAPLPRRRVAPEPQVVERGHGQTTGWWDWLADDPSPELQWPNSVEVFDRMMKSDSQVRSVLRAVTQPVLRARWRIDPLDAREEVVVDVAKNMGLPIKGAADNPPRALRSRNRFSWTQHLQWALRYLGYGHMLFNQVYDIDPATGLAVIRKLAPRWPKTIMKWETAEDGGLLRVLQRPSLRPGRTRPSEPIPIDIKDLVVYSNEREGGNWQGQSLLRSAYKDWILKNRDLQVWSQTVDRNGMGVPHYTASEEEVSLEAGTNLAKSYRSGSAAGGAGPHGSQMQLLGVQGALPDIEAKVRYHDESIARAVLAHVLNLGQATGTGSYALGGVLGDVLTVSLQAIADDVADVATMHIVEDLVDINWGPDEPAPAITLDPIGQDPTAIVMAIQALIAAGAIFPDPVLDAFVRSIVGLPPKAPLPNAQTPAGAAPPPAGTPGGTVTDNTQEGA